MKHGGCIVMDDNDGDESRQALYCHQEHFYTLIAAAARKNCGRQNLSNTLANGVVICCVCGDQLPLIDAGVIVFYPDEVSEERYYCHKPHFDRAIDKSIPSILDLGD